MITSIMKTIERTLITSESTPKNLLSKLRKIIGKLLVSKETSAMYMEGLAVAFTVEIHNAYLLDIVTRILQELPIPAQATRFMSTSPAHSSRYMITTAMMNTRRTP
jgi:hypothetical protein